MLPWELLHDRWNTGAQPLSVNSGMVRQFVTTEFRPRVQRAPGNTALVIGDPPLEGSKVFQQLPGAAAEATAVTAVLRENGFETTSLVGDEAQWPTVLSSLYGHPYRILHIAAHGVFEYEPEKDEKEKAKSEKPEDQETDAKKFTGVVLGKNAFLTPAEFEQLRVVPDLVFINCCHLGAGGAYGRDTDVAFSRLAANVAYQLIQMGVRAVVAAGWAVDDQAAKDFARRFYEEMLAGQEFGKAVLAAREEIFTQFGSVNTWGAYQCYGDPGFSMKPAERPDDAQTFAAERELRYEVLNLAKQFAAPTRETQREALAASGAHRQHRAAVVAEVGRHLRRDRAAPTASSADFDEAVNYYKRVLVAEPASASVEDIEQLANLISRVAAGRETPKSLQVMKRSTELLQNLAALGKTVERLSLLGGTAKRYAQKTSGRVRMQALKEMTTAYQDGYARGAEERGIERLVSAVQRIAGKRGPELAARRAEGRGRRHRHRHEDAAGLRQEGAGQFDRLLGIGAPDGHQAARGRRRRPIERERAQGHRGRLPRGRRCAPARRARWRRRPARSSSCETWLGHRSRAPIKQLGKSLEELRKALKGEDSK